METSAVYTSVNDSCNTTAGDAQNDMNLSEITFHTLVNVLISAVAVPANMIVILCLWNDKGSASCGFNTYAISLAFSDLLVGVILTSGSLLQIYSIWTPGQVECVLWNLMDFSLPSVSMFLYLAMGCDRYRCVKEPLQYRSQYNEKRAVRTSVIAWCVGLIIWLPYMLLKILVTETFSPCKGDYVCPVIKFKPTVFEIIQFICSVFIPLLILLFTNSALAVLLNKQIELKQTLNNNSTQGRVFPHSIPLRDIGTPLKNRIFTIADTSVVAGTRTVAFLPRIAENTVEARSPAVSCIHTVTGHCPATNTAALTDSISVNGFTTLSDEVSGTSKPTLFSSVSGTTTLKRITAVTGTNSVSGTRTQCTVPVLPKTTVPQETNTSMKTRRHNKTTHAKNRNGKVEISRQEKVNQPEDINKQEEISPPENTSRKWDISQPDNSGRKVEINQLEDTSRRDEINQIRDPSNQAEYSQPKETSSKVESNQPKYTSRPGKINRLEVTSRKVVTCLSEAISTKKEIREHLETNRKMESSFLPEATDQEEIILSEETSKTEENCLRAETCNHLEVRLSPKSNIPKNTNRSESNDNWKLNGRLKFGSIQLASSFARQRSRQWRSRKASSYKIVIMVFTFFIFWLPYTIVWSLNGICSTCTTDTIIVACGYWIYGHSACNPLIVILTSRQIRSKLSRLYTSNH